MSDDKPGRNDPCYCGSGQKYKKCHMPIDQAAERDQRSWKEAARFLRRDLLRFGRDEQFAEDFAQALPIYWHDLYTIDNAEEMAQDEALLFFDWFAFDYQRADGPRVLDVYREQMVPDLSEHQQMTLAKWAEADPMSGYELVDYEGQTLQLREFVSGEMFEVYEPAGRGVIDVGDVIIGRLVEVQGRLEFSTDLAYIPAGEVTDLAEKLATARAEDAALYPEESADSSVANFLRRRNYLFVHHALAEAEKVGRPPVARLDPDRPDKKTQKIVRQVRRLQR
ncbi:MAG: SEC-C domain-containing protein [Ardenticatenaceae bacterium]|nr:SEC-C domain-containing protein [Anaerolineales bacterium]MCB8919099.1 SEC-C domain-containing protein [Ardenticatenaceae bacterium]